MSGSFRSHRALFGGVLAAALLCAPAYAENTLDSMPDQEQGRAELERVSREITLSTERMRTLHVDPATFTVTVGPGLLNAEVKAAARDVWKFFVQREACGMRDQRDAIRHYGIPPEVLGRLGAIEK